MSETEKIARLKNALSGDSEDPSQGQQAQVVGGRAGAAPDHFVDTNKPIGGNGQDGKSAGEAGTLGWTCEERTTIDELMASQELSELAVLRQGLRMYQAVTKGVMKLVNVALPDKAGEAGIGQDAREEWEVNAPEGAFHGKHGHPFSYSVCTSKGPHKCIALAFGKTDEEALIRASKIAAVKTLEAQLSGTAAIAGRLERERNEVMAELARLREAIKDRETMAKLMHETWSKTKRSHGFHGARDLCTSVGSRFIPCNLPHRCKQFHADLIPWEQLPEAQKDINRHAFDAVVAVLFSGEPK